MEMEMEMLSTEHSLEASRATTSGTKMSEAGWKGWKMEMLSMEEHSLEKCRATMSGKEMFEAGRKM